MIAKTLKSTLKKMFLDERLGAEEDQQSSGGIHLCLHNLGNQSVPRYIGITRADFNVVFTIFDA